MRSAEPDLRLAQVAGLVQQALRLVAAAQVLLWCGQREEAGAALELRVAAGTYVADAAEQVEQALSHGDKRVVRLAQVMRALAAADWAGWTRAETCMRLRAAYDLAGLLLPAGLEPAAGRHEHHGFLT